MIVASPGGLVNNRFTLDAGGAGQATRSDRLSSERYPVFQRLPLRSARRSHAEFAPSAAGAQPHAGSCRRRSRRRNTRRSRRRTDNPPTRFQLVGLALSGGGIRSATFGLGVLEALKKPGLLEKIHYLSTVSGGGYIGALVHRELRARQPASRTGDEPQAGLGQAIDQAPSALLELSLAGSRVLQRGHLVDVHGLVSQRAARSVRP